jgi:hypothetical protein
MNIETAQNTLDSNKKLINDSSTLLVDKIFKHFMSKKLIITTSYNIYNNKIFLNFSMNNVDEMDNPNKYSITFNFGDNYDKLSYDYQFNILSEENEDIQDNIDTLINIKKSLEPVTLQWFDNILKLILTYEENKVELNNQIELNERKKDSLIKDFFIRPTSKEIKEQLKQLTKFKEDQKSKVISIFLFQKDTNERLNFYTMTLNIHKNTKYSTIYDGRGNKVTKYQVMQVMQNQIKFNNKIVEKNSELSFLTNEPDGQNFMVKREDLCKFIKNVNNINDF